jgi:hypothetical protein
MFSNKGEGGGIDCAKGMLGNSEQCKIFKDSAD